MNRNMIIDAYCRIRKIDNTIPDDVLDYMKNAALEKLESKRNIQGSQFRTFDTSNGNCALCGMLTCNGHCFK